jgi:hypothetical protein
VDWTWVFGRADDRIELQRDSASSARELTCQSLTERRTFSFPTRHELIDFQVAFESHLIASGWTLLNFSPERRSGMERRYQPRDPERRSGF